MSILTRPKILPNQRFDLEDWEALLSSFRTDSKLWTTQFMSEENLILRGFNVTGLGGNTATISLANAALMIPQNDSDFSFYVAPDSPTDITITNAQLTDNTRNFIEITVTENDNTPLTKAFWDKTANGGQGAEFTEVVNTMTDLDIQASVLTSGFSGNAGTIPIAILDVDASGNIQIILDRRAMFGRLSTPTDGDAEYAWGTKKEPGFSLVMSSQSGTFVEGEQITIDTVTATVQTGGTTSIVFEKPSSITFAVGDTVTGATSGATGEVVSISESFVGVDKNINTISAAMKAIQTEIKRMKQTSRWYDDAVASFGSLASFMDSQLTQEVIGAKWAWDGSNLDLTDESGAPLGTDVLGNIRFFSSSKNIQMTRETIAIAEDEIVFVKVPATGDRTFDGVGTADVNYQVVARGSYVSSEENYWLAYRENGRVYIRGYGELEAGESTPISDPDKETILAMIQDLSEQAQNTINAKLVEGGTFSVAGNDLTWNANAYIQIPGLTQARNTIAAQTITLPNATSVAYVVLNTDPGVADVLTVVIADEDAINETTPYFVIARKVTGGISVGRNSFTLADTQYLTIDGHMQELDNLLGSLRIKPHPSITDRVIITGADKVQFDGTVQSQSLKNLLLQFDGAQIDFTTGTVYENDGTTPVPACAFTPATIPANEYMWHAITLISETSDTGHLMVGKVHVNPHDDSDTTPAGAERSSFVKGKPLGQVVVQRNAGDTALEAILPGNIVNIAVGGSDLSALADGQPLTTELKDRFNISSYEYLTPNEFATDLDDNIDAANSTAEVVFLGGDLLFPTVGTILQTTQLLDDNFLNDAIDVPELDLIFSWKRGAIDTGATYEISRDGGTNFEAVTLEQAGDTGLFTGSHVFAGEPSNAFQDENANTGTQDLTDVAGGFDTLQRDFTLTSTTYIKELISDINKGGAADGHILMRIVRDDGGAPSTDIIDIVGESDFKSIDLMSGGVTTQSFAIDTVLTAGTYWVIAVTDQAYKDAYTANNADKITLETDVSSDLVTSVEGRPLSVILKVTSSIIDVRALGYGVLYKRFAGLTEAINPNLADVAFSGSYDDLTNKPTIAQVGILDSIIPNAISTYAPSTQGSLSVSYLTQFNPTANDVLYSRNMTLTGAGGTNLALSANQAYEITMSIKNVTFATTTGVLEAQVMYNGADNIGGVELPKIRLTSGSSTANQHTGDSTITFQIEPTVAADLTLELTVVSNVTSISGTALNVKESVPAGDIEDISSLSLDHLADVDTSTVAPTDGQVLTWDNAAQMWEPMDSAAAAPVDSVNGQTGTVVLDADDIDDSSTAHKFATQAQLDQIATNTADILALQPPATLETDTQTLAVDFSDATENAWTTIGVQSSVTTTASERVLIDASVNYGQTHFDGKALAWGVSIDGADPIHAGRLTETLGGEVNNQGNSMIFVSPPLTAATHTFDIVFYSESVGGGVAQFYAAEVGPPVEAGNVLNVTRILPTSGSITVSEGVIASNFSATGADIATGLIVNFTTTEANEKVLFIANTTHFMGGAGAAATYYAKYSLDAGPLVPLSEPKATANNFRIHDSTATFVEVPTAGAHSIELYLDSATTSRTKGIVGTSGAIVTGGVPSTESVLQVVKYPDGKFDAASTEYAGGTLTTNDGWEDTGLVHNFTVTAEQKQYIIRFDSITGRGNRSEHFHIGYKLNGASPVPVQRFAREGSDTTTGARAHHSTQLILENLPIGSNTIELSYFIEGTQDLIVYGASADGIATKITTFAFNEAPAATPGGGGGSTLYTTTAPAANRSITSTTFASIPTVPVIASNVVIGSLNDIVTVHLVARDDGSGTSRPVMGVRGNSNAAITLFRPATGESSISASAEFLASDLGLTVGSSNTVELMAATLGGAVTVIAGVTADPPTSVNECFRFTVKVTAA